jgi:hypothetical protein
MLPAFKKAFHCVHVGEPQPLLAFGGLIRLLPKSKAAFEEAGASSSAAVTVTPSALLNEPLTIRDKLQAQDSHAKPVA